MSLLADYDLGIDAAEAAAADARRFGEHPVYPDGAECNYIESSGDGLS